MNIDHQDYTVVNIGNSSLKEKRNLKNILKIELIRDQ